MVDPQWVKTRPERARVEITGRNLQVGDPADELIWVDGQGVSRGQEDIAAARDNLNLGENACQRVI
jgi:hypothetical protein